jgi:hypothetical protein
VPYLRVQGGEVSIVKSPFVSNRGGRLEIKPDKTGKVQWINHIGRVEWRPTKKLDTPLSRPQVRRAVRSGIMAWVRRGR